MFACKKCHNSHIFKTNKICQFKEHKNFALILCEFCKMKKACAECEKCTPDTSPQENILDTPMIEEMGIISEPKPKYKTTFYTPDTSFSSSHGYSYGKENQEKLLEGTGITVRCKDATKSAGKLVEGLKYKVLVIVEKGKYKDGEIQNTCYILDTKTRSEYTPFQFEYPYVWDARRFEIVNIKPAEDPKITSPSGSEYRPLTSEEDFLNYMTGCG